MGSLPDCKETAALMQPPVTAAMLREQSSLPCDMIDCWTSRPLQHISQMLISSLLELLTL